MLGPALPPDTFSVLFFLQFQTYFRQRQCGFAFKSITPIRLQTIVKLKPNSQSLRQEYTIPYETEKRTESVPCEIFCVTQV